MVINRQFSVHLRNIWFNIYMFTVYLQVDKAFDYMTRHHDDANWNKQLNVFCGNGERGIYLREPRHMVKPRESVVTVEPVCIEERTGERFITP